VGDSEGVCAGGSVGEGCNVASRDWVSTAAGSPLQAESNTNRNSVIKRDIFIATISRSGKRFTAGAVQIHQPIYGDPSGPGYGVDGEVGVELGISVLVAVGIGKVAVSVGIWVSVEVGGITMVSVGKGVLVGVNEAVGVSVNTKGVRVKVGKGVRDGARVSVTVAVRVGEEVGVTVGNPA
jgi:hypothetical protein